MNMNPYLTFDGQCEAAINFYVQALGGKVEEFHRYGNSPMAAEVPAEQHNRVMHVGMTLPNGQVLMASDTMPGQPYEGMKGITLSLIPNSVEEAEALFAALSVNATITMPMGKTFWAERFGMLIDQFGTPWMVNLDGAPAE